MSPYDDPFLDALDAEPAGEEGARSEEFELPAAPSVYLWGGSRPVVNLVLYAMAARLDPEFSWVHVSDRGGTDALDLLLNGRWKHPTVDSIDLHASELLPTPLEHQATLEGLLLDSADAEVDRLRAFVALPRTVQRIVSRHVPDVRPRVIAIPNADRLTDLYAHRAEQLTDALSALAGASVSILVGRADGPGPLRSRFDYVLEVEAEGLDRWSDGRLVVEHTPAGSRSALGRRLRLDRLPWAIDVFGHVPKDFET